MTNLNIAKLYLATTTATAAQIDAAITDGSAATTVNALTGTTLLNAIYQASFGRDADAEGLAYWGASTLTGDALVTAINAGAAVYVANPAYPENVAIAANDTVVVAAKATADAAASSASVGTVAAAVKTVVDAATQETAIATIDAADVAADAEAAAEAAATTVVMTNSNNQTTGGLDNITLGAGNDTIVGSTAATGSTYSLGDTVDGGAGTDTLYVTLTADSDSVDVVNVEQIDARASTAQSFDASAVTGTGVIFNSYKSKADLEFIDISTLDSVLKITDNTNGLAASFSASEVGTTEDAITLRLDQAGSQAANDYFYTKNIEIINIESVGSQKNWLSDIGSDDDATVTTIVGTDTLKTINVSGDQDLTIVTALDSTITTVDASTATGNLTIGTEAAVHTITGGAGDDKFDLNATLTADDTIDGGAGTDTLVVDQDIAVSMAKVTNVEVIGLDATAGNRAIDLSKFASATSVNVVAQGTGNTVTVTNAGTDYTFSASINDDISITSSTIKATATVTLDNSAKAAADTGIDLTNGGAGSADSQVFDNVETLTVNSVGGKLTADASDLIDGYNENSITGLSGSQLKIINVTGDTDVEITTTDTGVTTVDASAHTSNVQVSIITATDKTITMGAGNDKVTLGTGKSSVNMGAGDDVVAMAAANLTADDTINGGEGVDTLVFSDDIVFDAISGTLANVSGFEKVSMANDKDLTLTDASLSKLGGTELTIVRESGANAQFVSADSVNSSTSVVTVDGSSQTLAGALNYTVGLAQDIYTGTINADTVTVTDYQKLASTDSLNGGAGADTLNINIDGGATAATIKTLTAEQLSGVKSFNTINVDDATATYIGITLDDTFVDNNAASNALSIVGIDTTGGTATTAFLTIDASAVTSTVALTLTGGSADDTLKGGAGDDIINGGAGSDKADLSAGGADQVQVDQVTANPVAITGFTLRGNSAVAPTDMDTLQLDDAVFVGVAGLTASTGYTELTSTGTLADSAVTVITTTGYANYDAMFTATTAGGNAAGIVVFYNTSTQAVEAYYDADLQDTAGEVLVATFTDISLSGVVDFAADNFVGY